MALSSVILFDEMKSLVLIKRKIHQEINKILQERYPDMGVLSAMNVRKIRDENGIRTRKTFDDSEIEKEVTKSIAEVISEFLHKIGNKMLFYSDNILQIYLLSSNNKCLIKILLHICYLYHALMFEETTEEK